MNHITHTFKFLLSFYFLVTKLHDIDIDSNTVWSKIRAIDWFFNLSYAPVFCSFLEDSGSFFVLLQFHLISFYFILLLGCELDSDLWLLWSLVIYCYFIHENKGFLFPSFYFFCISPSEHATCIFSSQVKFVLHQCYIIIKSYRRLLLGMMEVSQAPTKSLHLGLALTQLSQNPFLQANNALSFKACNHSYYLSDLDHKRGTNFVR